MNREILFSRLTCQKHSQGGGCLDLAHTEDLKIGSFDKTLGYPKRADGGYQSYQDSFREGDDMTLTCQDLKFKRRKADQVHSKDQFLGNHR